MIKFPQSKRLRFAAIGFATNIIVVLFGMYFGSDLVALGTCLTMVNTPIYVYILGDSFRPSEQK